jgi:hypothetical protein
MHSLNKVEPVVKPNGDQEALIQLFVEDLTLVERSLDGLPL